ncbi:MAG: VCBS repeat domain-containing M23 family metallopeptidase [Actinomycetota bacterium]|nr:VCBS repeat domain-containing M23 family metallopeptidase [Actinomycetota bacterium]
MLPVLTLAVLGMSVGAGIPTSAAASPIREVSVSPSSGPDFELPFPCGQQWTGNTRPSHSPSPYAIDFTAPGALGKPTLSSALGVVTKTVSLTTSYGNYVVIDNGRGYSTLYAHLNSIAVTVGQVVDQGALVGYVGQTGNSTGPHLHFEERLNGSYFAPYFHRTRFQFGVPKGSANCGDRPLSGDWNGDGVTDVGVARPTPTGTEFRELTGQTTTAIGFGRTNAVPFVGDWDGDRRTDVGVRSLGTRSYQLRSRNGTVALTALSGSVASDTPFGGHWDQSSPSTLGYYRSSTHTFVYRRTNGDLHSVVFGGSGVMPVTGDWNGDGVTDFGTYDPWTATWSLRVPTGTGVSTQSVVFGSPGDLPVTGDWNGDHIVDLGVWHPSTATFSRRTVRNGTVTVTTAQFGNPR